jgi:hypothetical protein
MDKFINTSNGGIPYVNNDHRWSDESIRDFLNKLLSDFGVTIADNDNFIISGVAVTHPSTWSVTEGYVWINNEILKVDAGTYATLTPPQEWRWIAVTSYDTTGNKTTRSGSSIQTYEKRRAVPTAYLTTDPLTDDMMEFRLNGDRLRNKIDKQLGNTSYSAHNYITNGEKITESLDALDVKLKQISDLAGLTNKIIEIGNWDMSGVWNQKIVPHGITNWKNIRNISVIIRNDADDTYYKLECQNYATSYDLEGSVAYFDSANIVLMRRASGLFDSTDFNQTIPDYNRGWIHVQYV